MDEQLNRQMPVILAGAGHAHLVALKIWLEQGYRPPVRTVLINANPQAWYSGMMPGLLSGLYSKNECAIELEPLCDMLGIELIIDNVISVDANHHQLKTTDAQFDYQLLSINTGGQPPAPDISQASITIVPVKPFKPFIQAWQSWQNNAAIKKIVVVGGGAAAFEVSLALRQSMPATEIVVLCQTLLEQHPQGVAKKARKALLNAGVRLQENVRITAVEKDGLVDDKKTICQADVVVLATGASPLPWYQTAGLQTDKAGFIQINNQLQSLSHSDVFVTGDAASLKGTAHSGVYAVRQGPVLAQNISNLLANRSLTNYQPQKNTLALMALPEKSALMSYFNLSAKGQLMGLWKNYLDKRFVMQYPKK
jgi:NADH dehydrogenase FAD-containing subunit